MKNNQPLFSVLIANYNNGKYLMEAIESVRQQTYTNWEIILVDDASTDNSKELYKELEKDNRIHIYYNDSNKGCGYTKRRCAELANGEICGFLDPDDALLSEALQVMVEAHKNHPEASLVYSQHVISDANLQNRTQPIGSPLEEGKTYLESTKGGPTAFATFKRQLYIQSGGISTIYKRAVDQDLYLRLEEVGDIIFVKQALYIYRQGTGQNISLGAINEWKALCWDMYARIEACIRRGVEIDNAAFLQILNQMNEISAAAALAKEKEIRVSKAYLIGRLLLKPFRWIGK